MDRLRISDFDSTELVTGRIPNSEFDLPSAIYPFLPCAVSLEPFAGLCIQFPASNIEHPASSIQHPTLNFLSKFLGPYPDSQVRARMY